MFLLYEIPVRHRLCRCNLCTAQSVAVISLVFLVHYLLNLCNSFRNFFNLFQVTIPALNDSKLIGMCLYNVVILSGLGLTLSLLLEEREVLLYGVVSGGLLIGTTLTQLMLFVPKVSMP